MSGYINRHGRRVPNPCHEIDTKGRDLDKVYRHLKPGESESDDAVVERILAIPEPEYVRVPCEYCGIQTSSGRCNRCVETANHLHQFLKGGKSKALLNKILAEKGLYIAEIPTQLPALDNRR